MTVLFLIVLRLLGLSLLGYFAYRLWTGTASWTSRGLAILFTIALGWQIIRGVF